MKDTASIEEKLIDSFKELVMKEPVEKITIKEIADGAGVIRTTFYYHFQDKYELVERIIEQNLVAPIMDILDEKDSDSSLLEEALLVVLRRLDAERPFYKRLAKMEGQNSFEEILKQRISNGLLESIERIGTTDPLLGMDAKYPWLTPRFVSDYYAQSVTYMLISFLNTDPPARPEEATEIFNYVVRHALNETILGWYRGK